MMVHIGYRGRCEIYQNRSAAGIIRGFNYKIKAEEKMIDGPEVGAWRINE